MFFRNFFAFIVLLPWLYRKGPAALKTTRWGLHLLRAIAGIAAMYLFFLVIANVPLAQATLVLLMAPFFIPIIAWFWLKERISRRLLVAILFGFCGVLVFLNPLSAPFELMIGLALIAAVLAAFTKTVIRQLATTESSGKIVFFFSGLATVGSALPVLLAWQSLELHLWLLIMGMGALAVSGQLLMTRAFSMASPSQVGVFTYSSVIFAALLGYFIWGELITWHMLVGSAIIIAAGYLALQRNRVNPNLTT